jgi:hypothetical protein
VLRPDGAFEDRLDDDPDFLTILNQPFAARLDSATLLDVRELRKPVPFAVRFQAAGPMNGKLPGHADANVAGKMRMDGTAYYALDNAMLLALNVTLTIDARLSESRPSVSVPVRITYRRSIRAAQSSTEARR